jgi:hypothetical protein
MFFFSLQFFAIIESSFNELDRNMVYCETLWHNLIHVANPT